MLSRYYQIIVYILLIVKHSRCDNLKDIVSREPRRQQQNYLYVLPSPEEIEALSTKPTINAIGPKLDTEEFGHLEETTTPLLVTAKDNSLEGRGLDSSELEDNSRVSMKLTVLEAVEPSKLIAYPNVHENFIQPEYKLTENRQPLIRADSDKMIEFTDIITDIRHQNETKFEPIRQTVSIDMSVLPESKMKSNATVINVLPIAQKLQQAYPNIMPEEHYPPEQYWQFEENFVCQIHRCDEQSTINRDAAGISNSESEFPVNIDFNVGTDILKDIWNNHINSVQKVALEIVEVTEENTNPPVEFPENQNDESLFRLGLGSNFDPAMKPPPVSTSKPVDHFNPYMMYPELLQPHQINSPFFNQRFENLESKIGETEKITEDPQKARIINKGANNQYSLETPQSELLYPPIEQSVGSNSFIPIKDTSNFNSYIPYDMPELNHPIEQQISGGGQLLLNDKLKVEVPQHTVFPYMDTLLTKIGVADDFRNPPVSHLLPPSVLPSIHEDASEGRIVQTDESTRIILRLKPSSLHPKGEVLSLPASKFNQFGTADLTLDSGQKVSVRIKHSRGKDQESKSSLLIHSENGQFRNGEGTNDRPIPITILRDSKTGIPVMALPGLKPAQSTVLNDKQKQLPPLTVPFINQLPLVNQVSSPSILSSNLGESSGTFSENIDILRDTIRLGFRGFMSQFEAIPSTMESNVFDSFETSVDFLRRFYGNALPESYFGDSMTVMSMAAFLAFLGGRVSDISTTLTNAGIGRRALTDLEGFMGVKNTIFLKEIMKIIEEKLRDNLQDNPDESFERSYIFSRESDNSDTTEGINYLQEFEAFARLVETHTDIFGTASNQSIPCLQQQLCLLIDGGSDTGGMLALIAPLLSTTMAGLNLAGNSQLPFSLSAINPLQVLTVLRPLWLSKSTHLVSDEGPNKKQRSEGSACDVIYCPSRNTNFL